MTTAGIIDGIISTFLYLGGMFVMAYVVLHIIHGNHGKSK